MTSARTRTALTTLLLGPILTLCLTIGNAQPHWGGKETIHHLQEDYDKISDDFEEAYHAYPTIPRGILEAVSYQYRRFSSREIEYEDNNEHTIPRTYTVMGLTANGKGVFRENLQLVESLSSFSKEEILENPRSAIMAYAEAFAALQQKHRCFSDRVEEYLSILIELSELPYAHEPTSWMDNYPINSSLYEIYRFLSDSSMITFTHHHWSVDFELLFGADLNRLRRETLALPANEQGTLTSPDYPGATWLGAASCNYTQGRNGAAITGVTIHYTQGTYAGTLAWFQNCSASASAHYIIRSSDGQVTQMVRECDKAWHVGTANSYTIGVEHEAYGNIASYFTENMYQSSAALIRDICQRHPNINPHRTFYRDTLDDGTVLNNGLHSLGGSTACTQIRGHQHYPNQSHTDPGPYWNWNHYYHLINSQTCIVTDTSTTGTWYDSGGNSSPYSPNEHRLFLLHHPDADSITLDFSQFDLETGYDFLWIYNGDNLSAPLLGRWNTSSPSHIVSSGPSLLMEFRSDCATQNAGWEAHWICHQQNSPSIVPDTSPPTTDILHDDTAWVTGNFWLHFTDTDDQQIRHRLWQVMERNGHGWQCDPRHGFLCDNFDNELDTSIWQQDGHWHLYNQKLTCSSTHNSNPHIYARHHDGNADCYLYDFLLTMSGGDSCSFFFHLQKDAASNPWEGYEICFEKSRHRASIYQLSEGARTLLGRSNAVYISDNTSYLYRVLWDTTHQRISLFRHQTLLAECQTGSTGTGNHERFIGFRCHDPIQIDNLRIYAGRGDSITISVGSADTCLMHAQASQGMANCKIKSIVMDEALNFSNLAERNVKIDYTPPPPPVRIETSLATGNTSRLKGIPVYGQWETVGDNESGVAGYDYMLHVITLQHTCLRETIFSTTHTHTMPQLEIPLQSASCVLYVRCRDRAGNVSNYASAPIPLSP
ncbi:MAG: N-acetylmuramoyl-L-alanine amidase [Bacteroidales bacterium]|nr:N-acetylmuramoyl-L-alanine amidase [Bacteroidales bacterium]